MTHHIMNVVENYPFMETNTNIDTLWADLADDIGCYTPGTAPSSESCSKALKVPDHLLWLLPSEFKDEPNQYEQNVVKEFTFLDETETALQVQNLSLTPSPTLSESGLYNCTEFQPQSDSTVHLTLEETDFNFDPALCIFNGETEFVDTLDGPQKEKVTVPPQTSEWDDLVDEPAWNPETTDLPTEIPQMPKIPPARVTQAKKDILSSGVSKVKKQASRYSLVTLPPPSYASGGPAVGEFMFMNLRKPTSFRKD